MFWVYSLDVGKHDSATKMDGLGSSVLCAHGKENSRHEILPVYGAVYLAVWEQAWID